MERLSLTPFGSQPVSAGLLATQALADAQPDVKSVEKWSLFRDLCTARTTFGVSDRDLTVLAALLSFLPDDDLEDGRPLIVFPSNKSLSQRAHGMAESTLRRHLAALTRAGLVLRQDSPNGKRYARRDASGTLRQAFGFDLRPLLVAAQNINDAAEATRQAEAERRVMKEACTLRLRDAMKLREYGSVVQPDAANWDHLDDVLRLIQRRLRRKLENVDIAEINDSLADILETIRAIFDVEETEKVSGKDAENERHHHSSKTKTPKDEQQPAKSLDRQPKTIMPLSLIRRACQDLAIFGGNEIRTYPDIIRNAERVVGMLGIRSDIWSHACAQMGATDAAITVGFILEKAEKIQSPAGYLRALTQKSKYGRFSTGPLVMSLLNPSNSIAA